MTSFDSSIIMEEVIRVFFHELGHFVAAEINSKYFGELNTESIEIRPYPTNPNLYVGDHRLNPLPEGKKREIPTKEKLAKFLALSLYGCLFQAYEQKTTLKYCFEVNGSDDTNNRNASLLPINWTIPEIGGIEMKYFEAIKEYKILDDFMKLKPEKYLIEAINQVYYVNVELLRKDTANLVVQHFDSYRGLLDQYNAVINENFE